MKKYKVFIFDFDNTIADTEDAVVVSFQKALALAQLPPILPENIVKNIGIPAKQIFERHIPGYADDFYTDLVTSFRSIYRDISPTKIKLFDGMLDLFKKLKEKNAILSIATSKGSTALRENLDQFGITNYFDQIIAEDNVVNKKPHPESIFKIMELNNSVSPENFVMIGDTTFDIDMGNAAQIDTIAVLWGAHDRTTIEKSNPTHIADRPSDISNYI